MKKSKSKKFPRFSSIEELVEFFDTHDLGDYLDQMPEAHFDIDIKKRRHTFAIDEEIANKLTELAKSKGIPSEALINLWLKEKVEEKV
jgi:hypothetical protein